MNRVKESAWTDYGNMDKEHKGTCSGKRNKQFAEMNAGKRDTKFEGACAGIKNLQGHALGTGTIFYLQGYRV